jgi:methionyl-tRNA formyltransferase
MNISVLATVEAGLNTLSCLAPHVKIDHVIGLSPGANAPSVAGWVDVPEYCRRHELRCVTVDDYSLRSPADRQKLESLSLDVLLVLGWQRLVPAWLIDRCRIGVVGAHGSSRGITGGRGRSPQNWALLLGNRSFEISIFWIDPGVDSGAVIDSRVYPLTEFDDIAASYYKTNFLISEMIRVNLANGRIARRAGEPQEMCAHYLPQRRAEDGAIDWTRSNQEVYNFVRALSRPYPGAFSNCAHGRLTIWKAVPFDLGAPGLAARRPGEIVARFVDGALVIGTGEGLLLVSDYEVDPVQAADRLGPGVVLESACFRDQMAGIVERHLQKNPDQPVVGDLVAILNRTAA